MALGKVEICGVNTSKLPLLKGEEKEENAYLLIGMIDGEWYLIDFTES